MAKTVPSAEVERRERLVARWRASNESAPEFAKRHGESHWALYRWAKRAGRPGHQRPRASEKGQGIGRRSSGVPRLDLLPVRLLGGASGGAVTAAAAMVEIQLSSGEVVRVVGEVPTERVRAVVAAVLGAC